jgi:hypothetical protein
MTALPAVVTDMDKGLALLINFPPHDTLLNLIAQLAWHQPVRVVVGGNRFEAHTLARLVRRYTIQLEAVLGRIQIARPFTCYQTVTLFEQLAATPEPLIVLDLLQTFADESISTRESYRLLYLMIDHLHRLRQAAPVIISLKPPPQPDRAGLVTILKATADVILLPNTPNPPTPLRLF